MQMELEECCVPSLAANEKSISCSILLWCSFLLSFVSSFCWLLSESPLPVSPHLSPHCLSSSFLPLSLLFLQASCSVCLIWAFLSSSSRQNNPRPLWTATPNVHAHTHTHTLPSANHTQEMGSYANEARLASGTQDGVSGLKTFSSGGNWTWAFFPLLFILPSFLSCFLLRTFFHSVFVYIQFATKICHSDQLMDT